MTEFLILVLVVLVQGLFIWISVRAKPLGGKPYKWATYVGITSGVLALSLLCFAIAASNPTGAVMLAGLMAIFALACAGILLRKKFGVVFFVLGYSMLILSPRNGTAKSGQSSSMLGILIFLVCTIVYFKRRWTLLGGARSDVPGASPNPGSGET